MTLGLQDSWPRENLGNVVSSMSFCGRLFSEQELELMREMREGRMSGVSAAVEEVTGRKARTFGEFARGNREAFLG